MSEIIVGIKDGVAVIVHGCYAANLCGGGACHGGGAGGEDGGCGEDTRDNSVLDSAELFHCFHSFR